MNKRIAIVAIVGIITAATFGVAAIGTTVGASHTALATRGEAANHISE
jgi:hypothetical protein